MFNRELLVKLRAQANLTQRKLAKAAGVPHGTICGIESGHVIQPTARTMKNLARTLGVEWSIFFEDDDCSIKQNPHTPTKPAA